MIDLTDPGTPKARRAWLDGLPVGAVVVAALGSKHHKTSTGWGGKLGGMSHGAIGEWCGNGRYWPAKSVTLPEHSPAIAITRRTVRTWRDSDGVVFEVTAAHGNGAPAAVELEDWELTPEAARAVAAMLTAAADECEGVGDE